MLSTSLMTSGEILATPPTLLPAVPQWANFGAVFDQVPFLRYLANSFIVATSVTLASLVVQSMAGYSLARLQFRGRDALFLVVLSTLMIPFVVIVVPLFVVVHALGWIDTYWGLIIPLIPNAYGLFLFRQFFLSMPRDLEDAAVVDGATPFQVFRKVAVPLARPVFAALGALYFLVNWNTFLWPLIVSQDSDMWTVQVGMQNFAGRHVTHWELIMAGSTVAIVPGMVLFFFLQRRLVEGIKLTGLRG
jgi:multiple sugar transport system permease protein